jgi:hypothetical protein
LGDFSRRNFLCGNFPEIKIYACVMHYVWDVTAIKCTVKFTHEEQSAEGVPDRKSTYWDGIKVKVKLLFQR